MTVYNTATAGDVTPGTYTSDGSKWLRASGGMEPGTTVLADLTTDALAQIKEIFENSDIDLAKVGCKGPLSVGNNTYQIGYFGLAGCWMTENLREIPAESTVGVVGAGNGNYGKYYNYPNNMPDSVAKYGYLYTWEAATQRDSLSVAQLPNQNEAANTAGDNTNAQVQGVCPAGWHVPSDKEWSQLEDVLLYDELQTYSMVDSVTRGDGKNLYTASGVYRGGIGLDSKMRTANYQSNYNAGWKVGKSREADDNGFSTLPAGYWDVAAVLYFGLRAAFWSSSSNSASTAWRRYIANADAGVYRVTTAKSYQFSVRCKKN
jgi:uncharacterized protein (TIGR02145 family)